MLFGKKLLALVVTVQMSVSVLCSAELRVSFLETHSSLNDTLSLLERGGCTKEAVSVFKEAVRRYYESKFEFNRDKFPKSQEGFYSFATSKELIGALPHPAYETDHPYDINCFDVMIVLAGNRLNAGIAPDEISGPFLFSKPTTNGVFLSLAPTARDAFSEKYPDWYRDVVDGMLPNPSSNSRICNTASLFRDYLLPKSATEQDINLKVMDVLRSTWKRQNLVFPKDFEVVLCHQVNLPRQMIGTTHAALLLPRGDGFTYIEKAGGTGPFVRLDLNKKADLLPWLTFMFRGPKDDHTHLFATFNDKQIHNLEAPK